MNDPPLSPLYLYEAPIEYISIELPVYTPPFSVEAKKLPFIYSDRLDPLVTTYTTEYHVFVEIVYEPNGTLP